ILSRKSRSRRSTETTEGMSTAAATRAMPVALTRLSAVRATDYRSAIAGRFARDLDPRTLARAGILADPLLLSLMDMAGQPSRQLAMWHSREPMTPASAASRH